MLGYGLQFPCFGFDPTPATSPTPSCLPRPILRVSVVSELEAHLHRVQAARKAALTLTLLPASEMLDESGDSA